MPPKAQAVQQAGCLGKARDRDLARAPRTWYISKGNLFLGNLILDRSRGMAGTEVMVGQCGKAATPDSWPAHALVAIPAAANTASQRGEGAWRAVQARELAMVSPRAAVF